MKLIHGINGKKVRGVTTLEQISIVGNKVSYRAGSLSAPTLVTTKDVINTVVTGGTYDIIEQQLSVLSPINANNLDTTYTITNLSPTIGSLDTSTLYLSVTTTGQVTLQLNNKFQKKQFTFDVSKTVATGPSSTFSDFVTGSVRKHMKDTVFASISGKVGDNPFGAVSHDNPTGAANVQRYTQWLEWDFWKAGGYTLPTAQYNQWLYYQSDNYTYWVKNTPANTGTGTILNSVNLTSISLPYFYTTAEIQAVYPSYDPNSGMGTCATLISPRHVYGANHWHPFNGMIVKFMGTDGIVYTRTIVNSVTDYTHDFWVGLLDSDLPATVKPMKILPSNYLTYMPGTSAQTLCYMVFPSYGCIQLGKYYELYDSIGTAGFGNIYYYQNTDPYYSITSWQWGGLFGSGSPVFAVINGEAVLLFCLWHGGFGYSGCSIHQNQTLVNSMMATLGTSYQLTPVTLSGFNTY